MQILCKSEYQDIYRIKDGVLLVVNKFDYTIGEEGYYKRIDVNKTNSKKYENGCKDLKVVTSKIVQHDGSIVKAGQVLYHNYLVKIVPKDKWDYQIKTTGDMFSGNAKELLEYIDNIIDIIKHK